MLRVGVYTRVSTDDQATRGYSLSSQLKACRQRANELGATNIIDYIDDGHSGAFLDRPGMNELREAIRRKEIDVVICYDPDRFARNLSHQLIVTEEIENSGARLEFINFDWQNTPEGRLFYSIRGAVSAYEREKIKERSMRGKKEKALAGKIVNNTNPYGYRYDKEAGTYVIHEEEAEMVRNIFKWYTEEGLGLLRICERLALHGYRTRTGKPYWAISSVNHILTNEMYTGTAWAFKTYKRKIAPKKYDRYIRPKEDWVAIPVPQIIDHATFEATKRQAALNLKWADRNVKHNYLLRGLVECPVCGARMNISYTRKGNKKTVYYRCPTGKVENRKHIGQAPPMCPARTIPAAILEELFWEELLRISSNPKLLKETIKDSTKTVVDTKDIEKQLASLDSAEKKLIRAKEKILGFVKKELISDDDAEKELKAIREQFFGLSEERKKLEIKQHACSEVVSKKDIVIKKVKQISKTMVDADFEQKRATVLEVVEKVVAKRTDSYWGEGPPSLKISILLDV